MGIRTYIDGIKARLANHPHSHEEAEIHRSLLRIEALYAQIESRANQGDAEASAIFLESHHENPSNPHDLNRSCSGHRSSGGHCGGGSEVTGTDAGPVSATPLLMEKT